MADRRPGPAADAADAGRWRTLAAGGRPVRGAADPGGPRGTRTLRGQPRGRGGRPGGAVRRGRHPARRLPGRGAGRPDDRRPRGRRPRARRAAEWQRGHRGGQCSGRRRGMRAGARAGGRARRRHDGCTPVAASLRVRVDRAVRPARGRRAHAAPVPGTRRAQGRLGASRRADVPHARAIRAGCREDGLPASCHGERERRGDPATRRQSRRGVARPWREQRGRGVRSCAAADVRPRPRRPPPDGRAGARGAGVGLAEALGLGRRVARRPSDGADAGRGGGRVGVGRPGRGVPHP